MTSSTQPRPWCAGCRFSGRSCWTAPKCHCSPACSPSSATATCSGSGTALAEHRAELPTWRGQNEQGMALAAVGFARATDRRQVMAATSSIGPGALNMVTAAGVAHANRLPLLLLPGDTFVGRAPDPVLQQVEHYGERHRDGQRRLPRRCPATSTGSPGRSSCWPHCPRWPGSSPTRPTAGRSSWPCPRTSRSKHSTFPTAFFEPRRAPGAPAAAGRARNWLRQPRCLRSADVP